MKTEREGGKSRTGETISIDEIVAELDAVLDAEVARRHREPAREAEPGLRGVILSEHEANFMLWHTEDEARRKDVDDAYIALQKRTIDTWNQRRNDFIEKIDEALITQWPWIAEESDLPMNTETPGSVFDRISIGSLKIYHMAEEASRTDATPELRAECAAKVERLKKQRADLVRALKTLLDDLHSRRKRLQVYRQFKMYNDPRLNPAVYKSKQS